MTYSRIYKILAVIKAYQLSALIPKIKYKFWLNFVLVLLFWIKKKAKNESTAVKLSLAIQELGPVWIKFGQMLSTRQDLLPADIINELAKLQDDVIPFSSHKAKQIIESTYQCKLDDIFYEFDENPLASASIAQVHTAKLKSSNQSVVIKILRPDIKDKINADINLMYFLAKKVDKKVIFAKQLRLAEVIKDYQTTILNELDLQKEAKNTLKLRRNFINSDMLYVPYVYENLTHQNIMVSERIFGKAISQVNEQNTPHINLKLLAERGVNVFFTQVFRDNFFHADMHPGNIFVDDSVPENPSYIGIDCAIMGELSADDQQFLAENFIAFFNRDYHKIATLYVNACWVDESTDIDELEQALKVICDPIFEKSLSEISFANILLSLFTVARKFNMVIQPQLVLLQKTLFYVEGLGRRLYPKLDLWQTAKPFIEKWYQEQISVKSMLSKTSKLLPKWKHLAVTLPDIVKQHEQQQKELSKQLCMITDSLESSHRKQNRLFFINILLVLILIFGVCNFILHNN